MQHLWTAGALLLINFAGGTVNSNSSDGGRYTPFNSTLARCLDGSVAGLYWRKGGQNSTTWILFLEGGPDCGTQDRCQSVLNNGGGTNKGLPISMRKYFADDYAGSAIIDPDKAKNPDFWDANVAYIPYCTADFHAGQRTAPVNSSFWFTGHYVIAAAVDFLQAQGVAAAERFLLSGGSSGGMGTFRNIDYVAGRIRALAPSAIVAGVPLGGFYFFQQPYTGPQSVPVAMDFSLEGSTEGAASIIKKS